MMSFRRLLFVLPPVIAIFAAFPAWALPEAVGEWRGGGEDVVPLVAGSEDVGRWTRRVYTRGRASVEVNLMEGSGPRWHGAGRKAAGGGGPEIMGETSEYETTEVAGRYAVLERHPLLPLSLAVSLEDAVLTLEGYVDEETLRDMAETVVEGIWGR